MITWVEGLDREEEKPNMEVVFLSLKSSPQSIFQEEEICYSVHPGLGVRSIKSTWHSGKPQRRTELRLRNGQVYVLYFFHQLKLFHLPVYAGLGGGRVSPRSSLPFVRRSPSPLLRPLSQRSSSWLACCCFSFSRWGTEDARKLCISTRKLLVGELIWKESSLIVFIQI